MLEVSKELWYATSYIYFEPLKIILPGQFESKKEQQALRCQFQHIFFVIKKNMLHPL